jgi:hypothetical protein
MLVKCTERNEDVMSSRASLDMINVCRGDLVQYEPTESIIVLSPDEVGVRRDKRVRAREKGRQASCSDQRTRRVRVGWF